MRSFLRSGDPFIWLSGSALAQEPESPRIQYQDVTEVDFDGVDVNATVDRPELSYVTDRPETTFNPLLRLRRNFTAEMNASVLEVR